MPSATLPTTPSPFTIAIIGGGLGGLTTALSIAYHSPSLTHITVYEQAPQYREIGAGVGIGVNAARILKKLGVWTAANDISGERNGVHRSCRRFDTGEEIVSVGAMDEGGEGGVRQLSVHRAEILEVLYRELKGRYKGRVKLETDMKATSVEVSVYEIVNALTQSLTTDYFRTMAMKSPSTSPTRLAQPPLQTSSSPATESTAQSAVNSRPTNPATAAASPIAVSFLYRPSAQIGPTKHTR